MNRKLDDASDYPELPSANAAEVKKYNEKMDSLQIQIEEKKKSAEKVKESEWEKKPKLEEFKEVDDYIIKDDERGGTLSDFIFVKNTGKQQKKGGKNKNKNTITLIPNFH